MRKGTSGFNMYFIMICMVDIALFCYQLVLLLEHIMVSSRLYEFIVSLGLIVAFPFEYTFVAR